MSNNAQGFAHPLVHKGDKRSGRVLDALSASMPIAGPGVLSKQLPGGAVLEARRVRTANPLHPWKGGNAGEGKIRIAGGSYNSTPLEAETAIEGTGWFWLEAVWTLTIEDDYLVAAVLDEVTLEHGEEVPVDEPGPDATATFHVPLLQYADGRILSQAATRSISAVVCDAGLADGTAMHTILQS